MSSPQKPYTPGDAFRESWFYLAALLAIVGVVVLIRSDRPGAIIAALACFVPLLSIVVNRLRR